MHKGIGGTPLSERKKEVQRKNERGGVNPLRPPREGSRGGRRTLWEKKTFFEIVTAEGGGE